MNLPRENEKFQMRLRSGSGTETVHVRHSDNDMVAFVFDDGGLGVCSLEEWAHHTRPVPPLTAETPWFTARLSEGDVWEFRQTSQPDGPRAVRGEHLVQMSVMQEVEA